MKETRSGFRVFEYFDSNTWYIAGLSNSLKNTFVEPIFLTEPIFLRLALIGSWWFATFEKLFSKSRDILRVWIIVSKHGNPFGIS